MYGYHLSLLRIIKCASEENVIRPIYTPCVRSTPCVHLPMHRPSHSPDTAKAQLKRSLTAAVRHFLQGMNAALTDLHGEPFANMFDVRLTNASIISRPIDDVPKSTVILLELLDRSKPTLRSVQLHLSAAADKGCM